MPSLDLSLLDFHVLLALAGEPLYGYALREAIIAESGGSLEPRAGSLYRVLARLMTMGLVRAAGATDEPHPGLARKYYALTKSGHTALRTEAQRLKRAASMAERRLGPATSR